MFDPIWGQHSFDSPDMDPKPTAPTARLSGVLARFPGRTAGIAAGCRSQAQAAGGFSLLRGFEGFGGNGAMGRLKGNMAMGQKSKFR